MPDDYGFEIYEDNEFPLAYLITFRTFGTWLHGDDRFSINRSNRDVPHTVKFDPNLPLQKCMQESMRQPPMILDMEMRSVVADAIEELCAGRSYGLRSLNVRTNHVHSVISAAQKPERIADAMKAFATKKLRELGLVEANERVWSRGRSRRYLWKPKHVEAAVNYVRYRQGYVPFELDEWVR